LAGACSQLEVMPVDQIDTCRPPTEPAGRHQTPSEEMRKVRMEEVASGVVAEAVEGAVKRLEAERLEAASSWVSEFSVCLSSSDCDMTSARVIQQRQIAVTSAAAAAAAAITTTASLHHHPATRYPHHLVCSKKYREKERKGKENLTQNRNIYNR